MPASEAALYKAHVSNLRAVDTALEKITRELNSSISRNDSKTTEALLKTATLLLGSWAENRLRKLSYEPSGFSPAERSRVASSSTQLDAWKMALELGFRKRHGIPFANLRTTLPITARSYYITLAEAIDNDLKPIIEVRNKLAHGQWSRALNSSNDDFASATMALMSQENAFTIKCKHRILEFMAQLIHDLIAGNHAFERDFDIHFKHLESAKRDISTRSYSEWLSMMRAKFERGKARRAVPKGEAARQANGDLNPLISSPSPSPSPARR